MQLDLVGRQIKQGDKKEDNAKVEELEMKEEKLSTTMATIMDPAPEKEVRPWTWNTLVYMVRNGKLPSTKKLKFKARTPLVGKTPPSARQATHLDFTNEDDEGSVTELTPTDLTKEYYQQSPSCSSIISR
jgi:hypothetical protein